MKTKKARTDTMEFMLLAIKKIVAQRFKGKTSKRVKNLVADEAWAPVYAKTGFAHEACMQIREVLLQAHEDLKEGNP